ADGAPAMTRADAARALGADLARLERALTRRAQDTQGQHAQNGLREDQPAAALSVLTDGKRVSVINAPAGSGKTRVLAGPPRAWAPRSGSPHPRPRATPWRPGWPTATTAPSSWAICPGSAAPAVRSGSAQVRCCLLTKRR